MLKFEIKAKAKGGRARAGVIQTSHGTIETPAFIPVATKATVKSLTPEQIRLDVGADAVLANTYHLYLQPGTEVMKKAGGLGKFMNWSGPTFTDSGGFQAFSLGAAFGKGAGKIAKDRGAISVRSESMSSIERHTEGKSKEVTQTVDRIRNDENGNNASEIHAKIDEDGVTFKSIIDGSTHRFTPERSIEIQHAIGADIIFAFDECTSAAAPYDYQKEAMNRTHRWAERSLARHKELGAMSGVRTTKSDENIGHFYGDGQGEILTPALFGIVQGGRHEDLRRESAKTIGGKDFDGFGIGGSFDKEDIGKVVGLVADNLPEGKPRHLLGIGSEPADLVLGIQNGMDTFDCVAPTRLARNGSAYVKKDRINLLNAKFVTDFSPIEAECGCYTCKNYTRGYLAHLFRAKEMLAATLTSIHNLYFVVQLVKEARRAILEGRFEGFKKNWV